MFDTSVLQQYPIPVRIDAESVPNSIITGRFKAVLVVDNTDGFFLSGFDKKGEFSQVNAGSTPNGVTIFGDFRIITIGAGAVLLAYPF
jgi:hypothetical protein